MSRSFKLLQFLGPLALFVATLSAELAAVAVSSAPQTQATQDEVTGRVDLTPAQREFFRQQLAEPAHWNMAFMIGLRVTTVDGLP